MSCLNKRVGIEKRISNLLVKIKAGDLDTQVIVGGIVIFVSIALICFQATIE